MKSIIKLSVIGLFVTFIFSSCSQKQLKEFEEFADYTNPKITSIRLPVIIIPGVKGSILKRGDKEYWGKSYRVVLSHTFDELQFPIHEQLDNSFDTEFWKFYKNKNVRDGGIMESYAIALPFINLFDVSIYSGIRKFLENSGGYSLNRDLFMFSYDWRLDNRISAAHLAARVEEYQALYMKYIKTDIFGDNKNEYETFLNKLEDMNLLTQDKMIKVNLVAHSMGGLVSRYYIQMLGGVNKINKLIMLGSPNQGAMDALKAIAEGEFPESILHFYRKETTRPILFSWPSTYQLLPRYPSCLKTESGKVNLSSWGLSPWNQENNFKEVLYNWESYNLIPLNKLNNEDTLINRKKYLKEQLINAAHFHDAINGLPNVEYERKQLSRIKNFADREKASIAVKVEALFLKKHAKTPFIIFGGYCEATRKYAYLRNSNERKDYLEFDNQKGDSEEKIKQTMGDGRVPIESLRLPDRQNPSDFQFLLCTDHTGVVEDDNFQYNLLSELLWQSSCVNKNNKDTSTRNMLTD